MTACVEDQLRTLIDLAALVSSTLDTREIRRQAVNAAAELVDAERASLLLVDKRARDLYFEVAMGDDQKLLQRVRIVPGQGIAGWVFETRQPVITGDARSDSRYFAEVDAMTGYSTRSMMCVPVISRGEVLGVLEVMNKRAGDFDATDLELSQALANHIAVAVENARLYERLRRGFVETWIYAVVLVVLFLAFAATLLLLLN